jgi:putative membrane protein
MTSFLIRAVVSALALWLAAVLVPGIGFSGVGSLILAALLLGLVNALVKPVVLVLTLPLTILTLGLFLLVVNAAMLGLVGALIPGFEVDGFWPALLGALVVSLVSWVAGQVEPRRG